jgi:hypothetical protein
MESGGVVKKLKPRPDNLEKAVEAVCADPRPPTEALKTALSEARKSRKGKEG